MTTGCGARAATVDTSKASEKGVSTKFWESNLPGFDIPGLKT